MTMLKVRGYPVHYELSVMSALRVNEGEVVSLIGA